MPSYYVTSTLTLYHQKICFTLRIVLLLYVTFFCDFYDCKSINTVIAPVILSCVLSDINECAETRPTACVGNAECINTPGSFQCSCPSGYKLAPSQRNCQGQSFYVIGVFYRQLCYIVTLFSCNVIAVLCIVSSWPSLAAWASFLPRSWHKLTFLCWSAVKQLINQSINQLKPLIQQLDKLPLKNAHSAITWYNISFMFKNILSAISLTEYNISFHIWSSLIK